MRVTKEIMMNDRFYFTSDLILLSLFEKSPTQHIKSCDKPFLKLKMRSCESRKDVFGFVDFLSHDN